MRQGYVYIMASKRNGTLYLGVTSNLIERVAQHKEGRGSEFVKKYNVTMLVWYEEHALITDAIQRETSLKRWLRKWKLELIEKTNPTGAIFTGNYSEPQIVMTALEAATQGRFRSRALACWVAGSSPAMTGWG